MRLQTCVLTLFQEENENADMCTNLIYYIQEENEIADICTSFMVCFVMRRMRLQTCVLIL